MVQVEVQEHTGEPLAALEKSNNSTGRDLTLVDGDGNDTVPTVSASSVIQISRSAADQQAIAGFSLLDDLNPAVGFVNFRRALNGRFGVRRLGWII